MAYYVCFLFVFINMEEKRIIAAFDFDGTLTTKDTLLEFIKFACGRKRFYIGFLLHSPMLVLMKVGLLSNWKSKERVFSWFFKGMKYNEFVRLGNEFAHVIQKFVNKETISILKKHQQEKHDVYIITASIEEWVKPYGHLLNVKEVLGTRIEIVNGVLTGRFESRNCYGKEKVARLLEAEPERTSYFLHAYGDSRGDKELMEFANEATFIT